MKGLQQIALLNPHQVAGFLLDVPNLHVRENFQRRTVTILQSPSSSGDSAHAPGRTAKEAHEAVGLAQRKSLQDDGFRFPGGHLAVGAPTLRRTATWNRPNRTYTQNSFTYHTRRTDA